jgi:ethanolamine utilization protein EutN
VIIARVVGNLTASQKHPSHEGKKILLIQPLDLEGNPLGDVVVALDSVDAGVGDRVLAVQEGFSAMTSVGQPNSPIDAAVIGVIDVVTWGDRPASEETVP